MSQKNETTATLAPREVILTRIINAPRDLVFEAWTEAKHIRNWFGPRIFRVEAESDARPGGAYRIAMIGTDEAPPGHTGKYPMTGFYKEFIKPEKIVFTQDLTAHPQDWKDNLRGKIKRYSDQDYLHAETTVIFNDVAGVTKVTIITAFESDAVRDAFVELGMNVGWAESLDKLEELLETADREILIERVINAPRDLVFEVWTDPKHLEKWWGPNGFSTTTKEFSFKPGGTWFHTMHGPDGTDYPNEIFYEKIVKPKLITYAHGGGDADGVNDAQFHATVTFDDLGDKTRVTMRSVFKTAKQRNHVVEKYGAIEGGHQHLANLDVYVQAHLL